ncbi:MAG: FHA domain-containing protein [Planctomycetota bacterium]|jgi:pSer/pThr/pTyr-binding forkhead associated (FHA) protein
MDIKLVMFRESGERREFRISPGTTMIGRKDDCDIRIPVAEVSRHHAELLTRTDGVELRDLGSANGSYVNNKRVTNQKLSAGDHLVVGPVVFTLQIDGKPEEIRPLKTMLRSRATAKATQEAGQASGGEGQEMDPISALEALASSADQTALDPYDDEEEE